MSARSRSTARPAASSAPAVAALAFTGAFTLSAWVSVKEFPTTSSVQVIAGKTTSTANEGWRFGSDLGALISFKRARAVEPAGRAHALVR